MSQDFRAEVLGLERVKLRFGVVLPAGIRDQVLREVQALTVRLQAKVKADYLRGPRPVRLGRITGTLSRSINRKIEATATQVTGSVGTNVIYGAAWELGHVKNWQKQVQPARPFLKPALAEMKTEIRARLLAGVRGALGGARP